ncbi:MAG TPA: orotidine-5'-phosphate decarboxylase [Dehalococcoidia bacterium]|nr:orotidine-5'-phosphate decarboxylase [Dehalococcoidia bacterium]
MDFTEKLNAATEKNESLLCIGLDPDPELMPDRIGILDFNRAIIDATRDLVCAYKLNFAFYEAFGSDGFDALRFTADYIRDEIPVIGDAKRADIGNTAKAYARAIFSSLGFDAATVNPYLGFDAIEPFIEYRDKGVFILCRTSNPGSADFQSLNCNANNETAPLFELVADKASQWNEYGNIGLVVGATCPEELKAIRSKHSDMLLLIPGVGAQGGDIKKAVSSGVDANGKKAIINSSRQIIYASRGKDFDSAARKAASRLRDQINRYRK